MTLHLTGYRFSTYTRTVKLVLCEKGLTARYSETDPFATSPPRPDAASLPFGRVPVLCHEGFDIFETAAITRYLDARFPVPPLTPADAAATGRMAQVIGIVDAHAYPALVRQVFAHRIFRPLEGLDAAEEIVAEGLRRSQTVLAALEAIATEGRVLDGDRISLADLHLAPVMDYFAMTPEGAKMLAGQAALARWWRKIAAREAVRQSRPDLSTVPRAPG